MRSLFPKTLISAIAVQPKSVVRFKATTALRSMNSGSTHRMFQLKLDPLTGNSEWVVIEEEEDELQEDSPKPLLATTSYLDMLNDSRRNRAYREAIDKTVTKPCHVLDIGAGTGLLSLMAARAMGLRKSTSCSSSMGTVTACESYLPMLKLMRKVLRANDMEGEIRVINKRSDELIAGVDFTSRADILVSEILDSELLGEGLIPTLQQAHDKLLVDNPQTVPYRATTYGQLVESTYLRKLHDLYNNEAETLDGIQLVPKGMERLLCVKPQQFAMHCDAIRDEIKLLSEPFKIFEFDFWRRPESYEETELQIKAIGDGTVHAVVSWWTLQLDKEATIFYSTSPKWTSSPLKIDELNSSLPGTANWCDHWKQCVWFIPGKGLSLHKDDEVNFCATHSDTSISYEIKSRVGDREVQEFRSSPRDNQIFLSPERVAIYGDNSWRCSMFNAVKNILLQKDSPLCIVADDSIFLAIAVAHLSKTAHVLSVFPGLRGKVSQYLQSVSFANGFSMDQVEVINRRRPQLTMDDTHHKKVDLLIAEPFYCGNDNGLPWQNLRFWKERTMLDTVLSEDVVIMPCKGILKACAMSMPDLWTSRRCLKEIEGFDHSVVNSTLGACGDSASSRETPCLPYFIWQCGDIKELSEIVTVLEFDFSKPISKCFGKAQVKFLNSGICHGFVLWIDWVMDEKNSIMLSTGPVERYWKQGVKLLAKPIPVECFSSIEIEASFDPSSAEQLLINHSFST